MLEIALQIIGSEADSAIRAATTLEEKCKAAFSVARNHWMFTDESLQFQAAIGAVISRVEGEDRELLEAECRALKSLNAMISGVPVDPEALAAQIPENIVGLPALWAESKESGGGNG